MSPVLTGRVSRREIALSPHVWFAVSVAFALFAGACFVMYLAVAPFERPRTAYLAGGLGAVAVVLAMLRPPEPNTPMTHLTVALTYVGTSAAMFLLSPESIAAAPAALFAGPLAALWLDDARHVVAHYAAASLALLAPSIVGLADDNALAATGSMLIPIFVLGICCRRVLTAAERQSETLESLAMRDPLTGAGNRRLLQTQGGAELARHAATRGELTVFALDLDGFKEINDQVGHSAGDELLVYVAQTLRRVAGERAIVVRQGGDEFTVLMPDTGASQAQEVAAQLQRALLPAVHSGIGHASFPGDATELDRLVELADARLVGAKERRRIDDRSVDLEAVRAAIRAAETPTSLDEAAASAVANTTISRAELGAAPWLWRATGAMFLYYAAVGALTLRWAPHLSGPWFPPLVASGAVVGAVILLAGRHLQRGPISHVVVSLSYVYPFLAILACRPGGAVAVGSAVFAGALIATRVTTRRAAILHTALAAGLLASAALLGNLDPSSLLAILMLIVATIVMSACCVIVFEAAEAQGRELERIAVVDPLTGLANRRRLRGALAERLGRGEAVVVLALDLNGFKALNDAAGHGAGDELLIDVAAQLRERTGADAIVARPGGDEFTIVLPGADRAAATALANELRSAVGRLSRYGHRIGTGIGIASAPSDGASVTALLEAADRRLLRDKYGESGRTPAAA